MHAPLFTPHAPHSQEKLSCRPARLVTTPPPQGLPPSGTCSGTPSQSAHIQWTHRGTSGGRAASSLSESFAKGPFRGPLLGQRAHAYSRICRKQCLATWEGPRTPAYARLSWLCQGWNSSADISNLNRPRGHFEWRSTLHGRLESSIGNRRHRAHLYNGGAFLSTWHDVGKWVLV